MAFRLGQLVGVASSAGADAANARFFFAGGGAYTLPRALRALAPRAPVTVAEIDPLVTGTPTDNLPVLSDDFAPVERLVGRLLITELGR